MKSNPKEFMAIEQAFPSKICSLIYFKLLKMITKQKTETFCSWMI